MKRALPLALLLLGCQRPLLDSPRCPAMRAPLASWHAAAVEYAGDRDAAEQAPVPLRLNLPFPAGEPVPVPQGPDGTLTHTGTARFAWDFELPVGSPALAAAGGIAVRAVRGNEAFGPDPSYRDLANLVTLDHGDGLFSTYVHLDSDGVLVTLGERVEAGQLLGWTGLSGQLLGPHLHFHVEDAWGHTLPVRFYSAISGTCDAFPRTGDTALAPPAEPFPGRGPSDAPEDLFGAFGVRSLRGLPARLFARSRLYHLEGEAELPARDVTFLLLPPRGGPAIATARWLVATDGTFSGTLSLAEVPAGEYAWALIATDGGPTSVPTSVRCALVD